MVWAQLGSHVAMAVEGEENCNPNSTPSLGISKAREGGQKKKKKKKKKKKITKLSFGLRSLIYLSKQYFSGREVDTTLKKKSHTLQ